MKTAVAVTSARCLYVYKHSINSSNTYSPKSDTSSAMSSVQAEIDSKPSAQGPQESQEVTKTSFESEKWMNDFWSRLNADSKAQDNHSNAVQTTILSNHTGRIQASLQQKLQKKTCTFVNLLSRGPVLHRRTRALQKQAKRVKRNPLVTIREVDADTVEPPKVIRLSEKSKIDQWVTKTLSVFGQLLGSDAVDASIKPRLRQIRQSLWTYRTRKGSRLNRCDLQSLSTEAAMMLMVTSRIAKYKRLLDGDSIEASFRSRLVDIIDILKSYQKDDFRVRPKPTFLSAFENEIEDHMKVQA